MIVMEDFYKLYVRMKEEGLDIDEELLELCYNEDLDYEYQTRDGSAASKAKGGRNSSVGLGPRKNVGEDPSRMISELTPGRKGGDFELPFGCNLEVPSGVFQKKDVVTCCMVSPSNRYKYLPPLRPDDKLVSEIYLFSSSVKKLKCTISLRFPYVPVNQEICDIILYQKRVEDEEWNTTNFQYSEKGDFIYFGTESPGIYVAVSIPKLERFDVPSQGCLYNAKINRQISIRFPKKATDTDMTCDIRIHALNRQNLPNLRREFSQLMSDLIIASDIFELQPSTPKEFRRAVTVKLPLPHELEEGFDPDDLAILQYGVDGWQIMEVTQKYTKNSVSFDTKYLSRFCIALAKPARKKRLKDAFKHIEREQRIVRGEILPFIHIQEKMWTLWFDAVSNEQKEETISRRLQQGFRRIVKAEVPPEEEDPNKIVIRRSWRNKSKPVEVVKERPDLDLTCGSQFDIEISGDVSVLDEDAGKSFMGLHFHDMLKENYRKFLIQPKPELVEQKLGAKGIIKLSQVNEESSVKEVLRTFDIDFDADAVVDFYYIEPEPEPIEVVPEPEIIEAPPSPPPSPKRDQRAMHNASWLRLTTPTKPPKKVSKESKVLTGRSLVTLAREIEQGLTLAIYLDLNDSTITGMGFDALAKGQSLVDITYKVLMLWKRKTSKYKDKQVDILVRALEEMGRTDAAEVVMQRHQENQELTPDCFDSL